jgi:hypothetical protein
MTPKTFFTIVIKILGIYSVLQSFSVVSQFMQSLMAISGSTEDHLVYMIITFSTLLLSIGVYFLFIKYLIINTDWIVSKLALDQSFQEEKFEFNIHRSSVLSIAVIFIGGITVVDTIPSLCKEVYFYVQQKQMAINFGRSPSTIWIVFYATKAFVGCLLMIYQRTIVNFIEYKRKQ